MKWSLPPPRQPGAFEFALVHHEGADARLPGREGRPAARGPGPEDKEFGFKPDGL